MTRKRPDRDFLAWIETLPSCISGHFEAWEHGEGRSVAAHVRRARDAGTSYKPLYSAVPLSDREHRTQSQLGEKACLEKHLGGVWSVEKAKSWFDQQAQRYREEWERRK